MVIAEEFPQLVLKGCNRCSSGDIVLEIFYTKLDGRLSFYSCMSCGYELDAKDYVRQRNEKKTESDAYLRN